ncbi:MAG TPA: exodeoxyribonuclease VII small subunit [Symbiobacteriaceae bacterium]|nr:exodeoxyribonuclease VII small subunit [Symbiobacteriaceae bacterium]
MEQKLSFEQALQRLEQVVRELETGELSLDNALALFQEGVALARQCGLQLDQAEARIEKLLEQNGEAVTTPLDEP